MVNVGSFYEKYAAVLDMMKHALPNLNRALDKGETLENFGPWELAEITVNENPKGIHDLLPNSKNCVWTVGLCLLDDDVYLMHYNRLFENEQQGHPQRISLDSIKQYRCIERVE